MGADWACMSVALPVRSQGGKLPLLKTFTCLSRPRAVKRGRADRGTARRQSSSQAPTTGSKASTDTRSKRAIT